MSGFRHAAAILLAAGSSRRMTSDIPKQFLPLLGEPMLVHSLRALASCPEVEAVVVAVSASRPSWVESALEMEKLYAVTEGGSTRQASLEQAVAQLPTQCNVVAVHDAARPLLRPAHLSALFAELVEPWQGVVPGVPLDDAIKTVAEDGTLLTNLDRAGIWRVQTPQVFLRTALQGSLENAKARGRISQDCSEMLADSGYRIRIVRGDPLNFKVTTAPDLSLAEMLLESRASTPDS